MVGKGDGGEVGVLLRIGQARYKVEGNEVACLYDSVSKLSGFAFIFYSLLSHMGGDRCFVKTVGVICGPGIGCEGSWFCQIISIWYLLAPAT